MRFEKITEDRFGEVILHLKEAFFADEPLNKAVGLCQKGEGHVELERHSLSTLADNLSVMALSEDNRIVGVALNGILHRGDIEKSQDNLKLSNDERFVKIFSFLYRGNQNIFEELPVEEMFEIRILSVDSECRGQGVAKTLLMESERVAKASGFQLMKADATGLFSQKISASLGFGTLIEFRYDEFVEETTGCPVFNVSPPHESLKIMYKWID